MKKLLLLGVLVSLGAVSCRNQCPAYSATKPATRQAAPVAAPVLASTAATAPLY
ncbi:hypothetical protein KLP40_11175 [Hymenobacter sp. NST-14]|uniref:hypothetical protein n=1 Tax=Hymenobacter piscis TaxID=2839984 RepID=UPI001C0103A5|nr:hypothetical protein [Hymenobacter piscis]MBT9393725.1 hypothetical protein [Hymenobacter piscis]